ncbi:MAG: NAD(P)-binding domain-containing protein [Phycisphaerales bacterium]
MRTTDIVIIGAGPIGIELAAAIKAANLDYLHLEAGQIGSTMQWWAPGTKYFSSPERIAIAGVPLIVADQEKATRENYLDYLLAVVGTHQLEIQTYTRVIGITKTDTGFDIQTVRSFTGVGGPEESNYTPPSSTQTIKAKRVILAIGDMHTPRMLDIPGETLPHVSHYLGDVHQYANQRVLIVGGKNSAVEAAIRLFRAGAQVTMSYRGESFDPDRIKYWLSPEIEYLIKKNKIAFIPRSTVESIDEHAATLNSGESIPADFVLLLTGYQQDQSLFEQLGIELVTDDRKPKINLKTMETNIPGVFVAGTATAGSQTRTKVFIETSHIHVERIVAALQGQVHDAQPEDYWLEES